MNWVFFASMTAHRPVEQANNGGTLILGAVQVQTFGVTHAHPKRLYQACFENRPFPSVHSSPVGRVTYASVGHDDYFGVKL